MSNIHGFPKIFQVGSDYIPNLFKGKVEITEKVDGSMFAFGHSMDGKVVMRSKGAEIFFESHPKMFKKAVDFVTDKQQQILDLPSGTIFYGEYLEKPKHNILNYGRTPKNNIMIFGMMAGPSFIKDYDEIKSLAADFDLETVPLLYSGEMVFTYEVLVKYMETDSVLGIEKIEGVVVKNYAAQCIIGELVMPSFGKMVRQDFKERHGREWKATFGKKAEIDMFLDSFRTEARWNKAIQHLRDQGKLLNEPKDIGILLKEISSDIFAEETENIKNELLKIYEDQIRRKAQAGFPQYYKEQLARRIDETPTAA